MMTLDELIHVVPAALNTIDLPFASEKRSGKVRERYVYNDQLILITTDRVSAFDRILGLIPYKGQVLNQLSAFWFEQTRDIVRNHFIAAPDPCVTVAHVAQPLPVEVIVRGHITGVTSTSLWTMYAAGDRQPYGVSLPDGLQKNDPLPRPIITPTTKAQDGAHDQQITSAQIVETGLIDADLWAQIEDAALRIFQRGQQVARDAGLMLVDTKYEFGLIDGQLALIDEVHTPDSSRYWTVESYEQGTPENYSKEYLREWFAERGYRGDGTPPQMPDRFAAQVAQRYISVYEMLTGTPFEPGEMPQAQRISQAVSRWINQQE